MIIPDDDIILALHKKYAPTDHAFQVVYRHCRIIEDISRLLIESNGLEVDRQLVYAAALLHDIGYYPLFDTSDSVPKNLTVSHGVAGADLLRQEGIDGAICRIAERHTGVGLTRENILRQNLPLPARDLTAQTQEERLVLYADKLHTKSVSPDEPRDVLGWFNLPETYLTKLERFGSDIVEEFRRLIETYGVPDLDKLAARYDQRIK